MKKIAKGTRFGRLSVIKEIEPYVGSNQKYRRFECICSCPKHTVVKVLLKNLTNGTTKGCRCLQGGVVKHGSSHNPLYMVWKNMMRRCYDIKEKSYQRYGGKGIRVCKTWKKVTNFIAWAESLSLEKQRKPRQVLDRIDNDGNYCPENCRFVSQKRSNRNRRNNVWVLFKGKKRLFIRVWEKWGNPNTKYKTAINRYTHLGWSVEDAIR